MQAFPLVRADREGTVSRFPPSFGVLKPRTNLLAWRHGRPPVNGRSVDLNGGPKSPNCESHGLHVNKQWWQELERNQACPLPFNAKFFWLQVGRKRGQELNKTSFPALPMNPITGYFAIQPEDLSWRPSNLMKIPNADFLERTQTEILGARLWRLPPKSAMTLHKHIRAEEFYFVIAGLGRIRVGGETLTVPKHGGVLVGPNQLRQVFNDTESDALWLMVGAPEEPEAKPGAQADMSLFYPVDPKQLPPELTGVEWPPKS